jgi:hypothetical protein
VGDKSEQEPDTRRNDDQALEEIRQLFARYRRTPRHGQVTERDEPAEAGPEDVKGASALPRP